MQHQPVRHFTMPSQVMPLHLTELLGALLAAAPALERDTSISHLCQVRSVTSGLQGCGMCMCWGHTDLCDHRLAAARPMLSQRPARDTSARPAVPLAQEACSRITAGRDLGTAHAFLAAITSGAMAAPLPEAALHPVEAAMAAASAAAKSALSGGSGSAGRQQPKTYSSESQRTPLGPKPSADAGRAAAAASEDTESSAAGDSRLAALLSCTERATAALLAQPKQQQDSDTVAQRFAVTQQAAAVVQVRV